jgi:hypothetical protein
VSAARIFLRVERWREREMRALEFHKILSLLTKQLRHTHSI